MEGGGEGDRILDFLSKLIISTLKNRAYLLNDVHSDNFTTYIVKPDCRPVCMRA